MKLIFAAILSLLVLALGAYADDQAIADQAAARSSEPLSELAWLVGDWQGEGLGGACEEIWHAPSGGAMMGAFRMLMRGEVRFYEIMTIVPGSEGPSLRLKHFNPDLTGWEEKDEVVEFPFVSMGENMIQFDGLTYERITEDSLRITVSLSHGEGEQAPEIINCRLVK